MNISAPKSPATSPSRIALTPGGDSRTPQAEVYKPVTEKWTVEGQTESFSSTSALVAQGDKLNNQKARYTYTEEAAPAPYTSQEHLANAVGSGLQGALGGALGGAAVGAVLSILGGAADLLGGLMGGRMSGVSSAVMLVPVALGVVGGAAMGGVSGYKQEAASPEKTVQGTLQTQNGQVFFYPGGQVDKQVNLTEFQTAPEAPVMEATAVQSNPIVNTLKGAAVAAGTVPALLIPLAGIAAGSYVGYVAGSALDKRTELGRGLGVSLGAASTIGAIVALNSAGGAKVAGALAVGLGVAGAALGNKVYTSLGQTEAHHEAGPQWWNREGVAVGNQ